MEEKDKDCTKKGEKKGFFAKIFDKLDKKLENSAKKSCCCSNKESDGSSCSPS